VCCKVPEGGLDPNLPQPGAPIPTTTTTENPEVDQGIPPVPTPSFCGIRNPEGIDFKITGNNDNEAEYGEFPWMVAILKNNYDPSVDKSLAFCGGSLINPSVVITGAHCVAKYKVNDIKIRAGEWDTQTTKERLPYQERNIVNIITHKDFNPVTVFNDVALLILDRPVDKADNVGTICLPPQGQNIDSRNCFVSGWGKDVFVKYYKGDGGSPLVCPDPQNPKRYVLTGMVAWGIGCGEPDVPGVYADVVKFRSWVDQQLQRLNIDTNSYIS
ncbi:hypothetical protein NQ314_000571, partial [Rhamnusium bicolor]